MEYIVKINERTKIGKAVKQFLLSIKGNEVTIEPLKQIKEVEDKELLTEMKKVEKEGLVNETKIFEHLK